MIGIATGFLSSSVLMWAVGAPPAGWGLLALVGVAAAGRLWAQQLHSRVPRRPVEALPGRQPPS